MGRRGLISVLSSGVPNWTCALVLLVGSYPGAAPSQGGPRADGGPPTGAITGRVRLGPGAVSRGAASSAYLSRRVEHHQASERRSDLENVVVYLKDAPAADDLPLMRAQIRQEGERFVPHVLAITRGSTVEFPNFDPFFHNVFSLSGAATFDLGRYPQERTRARRFPKSGLIKVYCHIHSHMSAVIMVFDHPYFAVADANGQFSLPVVPAGRYTVCAWHERAGESAASVMVEAGRLAMTELGLPEPQP